MIYRYRLAAALLATCGVFLFWIRDAEATVVPADLIACVETTAIQPVRTTILPATVGDTVTFFVEPSYDATGRSRLMATLRAIGTKSLIYVEDAYYQSLDASNRQALLADVEALKTEFDTVIYPTLTQFFGDPWNPGIDNDSRITILLSNLKSNAGGYIDTTDEYPRTQAPESNEREMIYLNIIHIGAARRIASFASHEFTHLIDFNQKKRLRGVEDELWLNELRAEYASTKAGYDTPYSGSNLASRVSIFVANPSDSLTEWQNTEADYGSVNLFAQYLAGHWGEEILAATMRSSATGIASLDQALAAANAMERFADIFQRFTTAAYVESAQAGAHYAFAQADLMAAVRVNPTVSVSIASSGKVLLRRSIEDWAGQWIRGTPLGSGNETLTVSVTAAVPVRAEAALTRADGAREVRMFASNGNAASIVIPNITSYADIVIAPVLSGKTSGFTTGSATGSYPDEPLRSYSVVFERVPADTPIISVVSPSAALTFGGVPITVSGSGFAAGGTVTVAIDGQVVPATVVDDGTVTFVAPAHAAGSICLRVTVKNRSDERCDLLTYVAYADGTLLRGEGRPEVWIIKGRFRRHIVSPRIFDFYAHLSWASVEVVPQSTIAQFRLSAWTRLPMTSDPITWRIYEVNDDATKHWITCADPNNCEATWLAHGGDPAGVYTVNQQELNFYTEGPRVFLQ